MLFVSAPLETLWECIRESKRQSCVQKVNNQVAQNLMGLENQLEGEINHFKKNMDRQINEYHARFEEIFNSKSIKLDLECKKRSNGLIKEEIEKIESKFKTLDSHMQAIESDQEERTFDEDHPVTTLINEVNNLQFFLRTLSPQSMNEKNIKIISEMIEKIDKLIEDNEEIIANESEIFRMIKWRLMFLEPEIKYLKYCLTERERFFIREQAKLPAVFNEKFLPEITQLLEEFKESISKTLVENMRSNYEASCMKSLISEFRDDFLNDNTILPESPQDAIRLMIQNSNYYSDADPTRRDHIFGSEGIPRPKESSNDFTERYEAKNYIFDPLSLFFVLMRENISTKWSSQIMAQIREDLKNKNIDEKELDDWNSKITAQEAISDKASEFKQNLQTLIQTIVDAVQASWLQILNVEEDEKYRDKIIVKFVQPCFELEFGKYIIDQPTDLDTITKLFCENKSDTNEDFKTRMIENGVICPQKFINYLTSSNYNFLISEDFYSQFETLKNLK